MRTIMSSSVAVFLALASVVSSRAASPPGTERAVPQSGQETIDPVTIVGTAPYAAHTSAICSAGMCRLSYPRITAGRRLDIQFVSCFATGQSNFGVGIPFLGIDDAFSSTGERHVMLWNVRASFGSTVAEISQPIMLTVAAGHRPEIAFSVDGAATVDSQCTIAGELVSLL
jgi:hypothetical protein